ncbi:hypothetical protein [Reichenbachiella sp.]|uniref:hypothetical protein n=1 Tax=Reichenbachiella sp. TaxID=2184521 RepID=UPI0032996F1B
MIKLNEHLRVKYKFKEKGKQSKKVEELKDEVINELKLKLEFFEHYITTKPHDKQHTSKCHGEIEKLKGQLKDEAQIQQSIIDDSYVPFYLCIKYKDDDWRSTSSMVKNGTLRLLDNPNELEKTKEGEEEIRVITDIIRIETNDFKSTWPDQELSSVLRFYMYTLSDAIAYHAMHFIQEYWKVRKLLFNKRSVGYRTLIDLHEILNLDELFPTKRELHKRRTNIKSKEKKHSHLYHKVIKQELTLEAFLKEVALDFENTTKTVIRNASRDKFVNSPLRYFRIAHALFQQMELTNDDYETIYIYESMQDFSHFINITDGFLFSQGLDGNKNSLWYLYTKDNLMVQLLSYFKEKTEVKINLLQNHDFESFLLPPGEIKTSNFLRYINKKD